MRSNVLSVARLIIHRMAFDPVLAACNTYPQMSATVALESIDRKPTAAVFAGAQTCPARSASLPAGGSRARENHALEKLMSWNPKLAWGLAALLSAAPALAQVTFYEGEGFRGRAFSTEKQVLDLKRRGFNDRASSAIVERGRWQVCEHARFGGDCVVLRRGSYDSLSRMGLNDRVSSMRPVGRDGNLKEAPEPLATPDYEYRRRPNERVFQAPVTSVRAVMGSPQQRCWMERQQVRDSGRGDPNLGGAVLGAIIGGVLGHQVGEGRGKDIATVGGVVVGGAIGANVGRDDNRGRERNVRRCESTESGPPEYWDVTYRHRGVDHQLQMTAPPGKTIAVNRKGEPRQ